jgi:hypothetical protein
MDTGSKQIITSLENEEKYRRKCMFCYKCGAQISDNSTFCANCGAALQANGNPQPNNNPYAPAYQQQPVSYQQPMNYQQPVNPELTMSWYKFLIYFALWLGALLNLINGFQMVTGGQYGYEKELVYHYFGGLQALDVIVGLCTLARAGLGVYTALRLIGYYKNGPKMLSNLYLAVVAVQLIYIIGIYIIFEDAAEAIDFGGAYTNIAIGCVMMGVNASYFKKRAHLFVND